MALISSCLLLSLPFSPRVGMDTVKTNRVVSKIHRSSYHSWSNMSLVPLFLQQTDTGARAHLEVVASQGHA